MVRPHLNIAKLIVETLQNHPTVSEKISIEEGLSLSAELSEVFHDSVLKKIDRIEHSGDKKTIIFSDTYEPFKV